MQNLLPTQYALSAFISRNPFIRLLTPLILGIISDRIFYESTFAIAITVLCLAVPAFIIWRFLHHAIQFSYNYIYGITISVLLYGLSLLWCYSSHHTHLKNWYGSLKDTTKVAFVCVDDIPEIKEKSIKVSAIFQCIATSKVNIKTKGNIILYLHKSEKANTIKCGDVLAILPKWTPIKSNNNPGTFNYKQYCYYKNIFHTAYLTDADYAYYGRRNGIVFYLKKINEKCRKILQKYIEHKDAYSIAEAILLGYKGDIADNTLQSYANTGIVHIIAISGLHVGIIFMSMLFFFSRLPFFKKNKKLTMLVVIVLIWLFALFVGFHASVVRATFMMSMLGIGQVLNRKTSIYNSLFSAAFIMLCYNPLWFWDVGFQLSFVAVLSIVTFYKPIYHLFYFPHVLSNKLWQLVSVTTAAQILTMPLVLYYFHRFPLHFIVSNMIAIPFVTICLWAGLLLLIFSFVTPLAHLIGVVMKYMIIKVNYLILLLSKASFFTIDNISISVAQCMLLYVIIMAIELWLYSKKFIALLSALVSIFILLLWQVYVQYNTLHTSQCIIYDMSKNNIMEFTSGYNYYYDKDSMYAPTAKDIKFTLEAAHTALHVKNDNDSLVKKHNLTQDITIYAFAQKYFMRLKNTQFTLQSPIHVYMLVLDKHCNPDSAWLSNNIVAEKIVFTSGLYERKRQELKKKLHFLKHKLHFIDTDGTFICKF